MRRPPEAEARTVGPPERPPFAHGVTGAVSGTGDIYRGLRSSTLLIELCINNVCTIHRSRVAHKQTNHSFACGLLKYIYIIKSACSAIG